jgi:hypothetical protein
MSAEVRRGRVPLIGSVRRRRVAPLRTSLPRHRPRSSAIATEPQGEGSVISTAFRPGPRRGAVLALGQDQ